MVAISVSLGREVTTKWVVGVIIVVLRDSALQSPISISKSQHLFVIWSLVKIGFSSGWQTIKPSILFKGVDVKSKLPFWRFLIFKYFNLLTPLNISVNTSLSWSSESTAFVKSKLDISRKIKLAQLLNIFSNSVNAVVVKLDKLREESDSQPKNILDILSTEDVLKLDKSIDVKALQPKNIEFILLTLDVSNFDISIDFKALQPENIEFIYSIFSVIKLSTSIIIVSNE